MRCGAESWTRTPANNFLLHIPLRLFTIRRFRFFNFSQQASNNCKWSSLFFHVLHMFFTILPHSGLLYQLHLLLQIVMCLLEPQFRFHGFPSSITWLCCMFFHVTSEHALHTHEGVVCLNNAPNWSYVLLLQRRQCVQRHHQTVFAVSHKMVKIHEMKSFRRRFYTLRSMTCA